MRQELFAHFVLIALTRLFSNHGEGLLGGRREPRGATDGAEMRVNFKNSLLTVARHLEGLFLRHAAMLGETLGHIVAAIVSCRQKTRPNRSYPRRSRKPIGKWKPEKPGEGRSVGMTRQPMRRARKTPLPGNASLSEWRFPLSECHCPAPGLPMGANLERHFDRVMEFYTSHATLGGRVPLSFGEELALVRLVGYCGLLQQRTLAPGVSCLVRR